MGACLSCLGLKQDPADVEPSETERLLYDDIANDRVGYGTNANGHASAPDPEEQRRNRERLQDICTETANNLIDVQHTGLLTTIQGQPSEDFAQLLNTHFPPARDDDDDLTTEDDTDADPEHGNGRATASTSTPTKDHDENIPHTPHTPDLPSHPDLSEQREPPSPFTQAQIAAAATASKKRTGTGWSSNGGPKQTRVQRRLASLAAAETKQQQGQAGSTDGTTSGTGDEDEEEAWLASVTGGKDVKWDEIKGLENAGPLVVRLD